MKNNLFVVYSLRLARALINCGFYCVEVEPDRNKPWFNVYKFENTDELRAKIAELKTQN